MSLQEYSLKELASIIEAEVVGDESVRVTGISTLQSADGAQVSFLANPAYEKYLPDTCAAAVILTPELAAKCQTNVLVHKNPYLAYARLSQVWGKTFKGVDSEENIHKSAIIHASASIDPSVQIGACAVIQAGVTLKYGVIVGANCVIGDDTIVAENTLLHANVTVYHGVSIGQDCIIHSGVIIGSDGFGFAPNQGKWVKIAQLGGVVIGDNVEIGANTTIDRGALNNTVIEKGVKLDNQIQIAHNVKVGQNTAMAACCAVAGSTTIGENCVIGGASGIAGHLTITDNVHITAMTMVIKSLNEPGVYSSGTGVQTNAKWRRSIARLRQLDKMANRLSSLEKLVKSF